MRVHGLLTVRRVVHAEGDTAEKPVHANIPLDSLQRRQNGAF